MRVFVACEDSQVVCIAFRGIAKAMAEQWGGKI
jgi:hypothetical protein